MRIPCKKCSYPSGHTTLGWTTALILCEIDPAAQDALLKKGFEYGQSHVIAGFHWQSDVDAARVVAGAAFARLHTSKAYLKQTPRTLPCFAKILSYYMSYFLCIISSTACFLFVQKLQNEQEKGNKFNLGATVQQKNDLRKDAGHFRVFFACHPFRA